MAGHLRDTGAEVTGIRRFITNRTHGQSYKVKVTLKKKVPEIGGMRIGDTWTKGNKTSYTVWLPKGAQTGKKLNIYMNTGLGESNGQGPQIKKVIKAK